MPMALPATFSHPPPQPWHRRCIAAALLLIAWRLDVIEHIFPLWCRRNVHDALVGIYFPTSSEWSFFLKNYLLFVLFPLTLFVFSSAKRQKRDRSRYPTNSFPRPRRPKRHRGNQCPLMHDNPARNATFKTTHAIY